MTIKSLLFVVRIHCNKYRWERWKLKGRGIGAESNDGKDMVITIFMKDTRVWNHEEWNFTAVINGIDVKCREILEKISKVNEKNEKRDSSRCFYAGDCCREIDVMHWNMCLCGLGLWYDWRVMTVEGWSHVACQPSIRLWDDSLGMADHSRLSRSVNMKQCKFLEPAEHYILAHR